MMIKLGQTTTGTSKGVKYLWLVKDMSIYKNYSKKNAMWLWHLTGKAGGICLMER